MKIFVPLLLMSAVSACGATQVIQTECLFVETIRPTRHDVDVISDALVEQILRHNEKVAEFCP